MSVELPKDSISEMLRFMNSGNMKAHIITSPSWTREIEKLCQQLQVKTPIVIKAPTPFVNGLMNSITGTMVLSDGLLKLGGNHSIHTPPTSKNLSVIAHELSHWKDGFGGTFASKLLSAPIGAMAGIAALYLYDHVNKQRKESDNIKALIDHTVHQAHQEIDKQHNSEDITDKAMNEWKKSWIDAGRYALMGALGYGAGLMVARNASLAREFLADKRAVELVRDPEGMIQFLKDMGKEAQIVSQRENARHTPPKVFSERLQYEFKQVMRYIDRHFMNAHPEEHARFENIRSVGRELGLYEKQKAPSHVAALAARSETSHTLSSR